MLFYYHYDQQIQTSYCARAKSYYQAGCDSWHGAILVASVFVMEFSSIQSHSCTVNTSIMTRALGIHSDSDIAWFPIHYKITHFLGVLSLVCALSHVNGHFHTLGCYDNE